MSISKGVSEGSLGQRAPWARVCNIFLAVTCLFVFASPAAWISAQAQAVPLGEIEDGEIRTMPSTDIDRIHVRDAEKPSVNPEHKPTEDTCLLPPLNLTNRPTVSAEQLRIAEKAREEYQKACTALKNRKTVEAEKHLRQAVHKAPRYAAAWVTLGQILASQQQAEDARHACWHASQVDTSYVPAYLCAADIAARTHSWDEVLKLSARALELDPSGSVVAYEYHAAANLNLRNLGAAEKSALRALAIDSDHREPRVHFVLAQIYEAKGDAANEALQLRQYLEHADNPDDVAAVKDYLSRLEEAQANAAGLELRSEPGSKALVGEAVRWGPADVDQAVPPVLSQAPCPLGQILKETSRRTLDFIDNLQSFSASERVEQIDIDKSGKRRSSANEVGNYVAQVERNSAGYPRLQEYRSDGPKARQAAVLDSGMAAFALMFHPTHVADFAFRCEGLTMLDGASVWQLHFEESADPSKAFTAFHVGPSVYLPTFKGRAWIAAHSYDVMRIETDLLTPIPQISLQREHVVIRYAPVEFQKRHVRLWLPESTSVYIAYGGHQYERIHSFGQFQLFSVDAADAVKEPKSNEKYLQSAGNSSLSSIFLSSTPP
jgi:tetratricopeptide (TPR) repeat protein